MNGLILALILGQATAGVRVSVAVVRSTCVVLDGDGAARVVPKRAISAAQRPVACTAAPGAGTPRIVQHVEAEATAGGPERRVIEIEF